MKIYLIRHGESTSDTKQKYDGDYDDHLTERGMEEACLIASRLQGSGIEIVFSSSKIRAKETSEVIRNSLGCTVEVVDDLAEQNIYGAYLELGKDQPEEEYRKLGEILVNRDNVIKGAETYADFRNRIIGSFSRITSDGYEVVAVVTHGGPIRCIFREILKHGEFKSISNGAIIELKTNGPNLEIVKIDGAELDQSGK
ncbi:MAG: histidine phosphatase family protein [Candidatus Moraniibacteriota bacterium]